MLSSNIWQIALPHQRHVGRRRITVSINIPFAEYKFMMSIRKLSGLVPVTLHLSVLYSKTGIHHLRRTFTSTLTKEHNAKLFSWCKCQIWHASHFTITEQIKQRVCTKFNRCRNSRIPAVYDDESISDTEIKQQFGQFKYGSK